MCAKKRTTRSYGEYIRRELEKDPNQREAVEIELLRGRVATLIYDAREGAQLDHRQLANLIGSRASSIEAIEESNYNGNHMTLLAKVAHALDRQVQISLVPREQVPGRKPAKAKPRRKKAS